MKTSWTLAKKQVVGLLLLAGVGAYTAVMADISDARGWHKKANVEKTVALGEAALCWWIARRKKSPLNGVNP